MAVKRLEAVFSASIGENVRYWIHKQFKIEDYTTGSWK